MNSHWTRIKEVLQAKNCLDETQLNKGATAEELANLEGHIGVSLPESLKTFLAEHDGQNEHAPCGIYFGEPLLSTKGIRSCWDSWRSIDEEEMNEDCAEFMASSPVGVIKAMYTNSKWIPLTDDGGGNHTGLDFDPDSAGKIGQVIAFGRDENTKHLKADNFDEFLNRFIDELDEPKWVYTEIGWQCYDDAEDQVSKIPASTDSKPWWKVW